MRLNKLFFLVLFSLFSLSLALAGTVQVQEIIASGVPVLITGTCNNPGVWVSIEYGYGTPAKTIWVDQVSADANKQYSASFTPSQTGTYTVYASCQGETVSTDSFCVGAAGIECAVAPQAVCGDGSCTGDESCSSCSADCGQCQPGGGGGGGGGGCNPKWSCGVWNYCNASLEQSRKCNDLNKCEKDKSEVKACAECTESWVCSLWSDCVNGDQQRTCIDEHYCGTVKQKPLLVKSCGVETVAGPQPSQITNQLPPPQPTAPSLPSAKPFSFKEFWDKYNLYILIGAIALVLILIITLLFVYVFKPKKKAYNLDELKDWVKKEKSLGTSNEEIKKILHQQTGWTEEEIAQAFRGT